MRRIYIVRWVDSIGEYHEKHYADEWASQMVYASKKDGEKAMWGERVSYYDGAEHTLNKFIRI